MLVLRIACVNTKGPGVIKHTPPPHAVAPAIRALWLSLTARFYAWCYFLQKIKGACVPLGPGSSPPSVVVVVLVVSPGPALAMIEQGCGVLSESRPCINLPLLSGDTSQWHSEGGGFSPVGHPCSSAVWPVIDNRTMSPACRKV